ncbi:MAG: hypothetical protein HYS24_03445 [Ignavibacteriales bacterium]|nr:hypothetical protein [Ignavibacteriales bacterium]
MGMINLNNEPEHRKRINSALKRRGLKYNDELWEIHGPHPGFNHQNYVGMVYFEDEGEDEQFEVVINPHVVYKIIDNIEFERIETTKTKNKYKE